MGGTSCSTHLDRRLDPARTGETGQRRRVAEPPQASIRKRACSAWPKAAGECVTLAGAPESHIRHSNWRATCGIGYRARGVVTRKSKTRWRAALQTRSPGSLASRLHSLRGIVLDPAACNNDPAPEASQRFFVVDQTVAYRSSGRHEVLQRCLTDGFDGLHAGRQRCLARVPPAVPAA